MEYFSDMVNLKSRTNDNFELSVNVGYEIGARTVKMMIDTHDVSEFCAVSGDTTISIDIPAAIIKSIGAGIFAYDCILQIDSDNSDFLFGGKFVIGQGVS